MARKIADVLTKEDLSAYLKIPKSTLLYKLIREGKISYPNSKKQSIRLDLTPEKGEYAELIGHPESQSEGNKKMGVSSGE